MHIIKWNKLIWKATLWLQLYGILEKAKLWTQLKKKKTQWLPELWSSGIDE